jgi:hypothetical protein
MLSKEYFDNVFSSEVDSLHGRCAAKLVLHSGEEFLIQRIIKPEEDFLICAIHPVCDPGLVEDELAARLRSKSEGVLFDRLSIPYEEISHVLYTIKTIEEHRTGYEHLSEDYEPKV